jgi:AcrR family transcriptional regulator
MRRIMQKTTAKRSKKRPAPVKPALVRGEPVVRGVLEAAVEELARTGYAGLRIEDVAARAGVNKTTVYRRWPTKEDLVRAALLSMFGEPFAPPNKGSLREDMLAIGRFMRERIDSPEGRSLVALVIAEGLDSELMTIARSLRDTHHALLKSILDAAVARGELAPGPDGMVVLEMLGAFVRMRCMDHDVIDERLMERAIDILLTGALQSGKRR